VKNCVKKEVKWNTKKYVKNCVKIHTKHECLPCWLGRFVPTDLS